METENEPRYELKRLLHKELLSERPGSPGTSSASTAAANGRRGRSRQLPADAYRTVYDGKTKGWGERAGRTGQLPRCRLILRRSPSRSIGLMLMLIPAWPRSTKSPLRLGLTFNPSHMGSLMRRAGGFGWRGGRSPAWWLPSADHLRWCSEGA